MIVLPRDSLPMLKLVHINVPWKFLDDYIDTIIEFQMNIEIGFAAEELDRVSRAELKKAASRLHQRGCAISLHSPFWDLCPGSRDPLIRQVTYLRLHQFFDLVGIFEPGQVVCHTGYDPRHHRGQRQFWMEKSVPLWESMVERAEKAKVLLLLENVWEDEPGFHVGLLQAIDSPWFGFCLDVGHQNSFSESPLEVWVKELEDYLKEVHLHDNDGTQDAHLPIGQGNIDFLFLFEFLQRRSIAPMLTLEPHKEEHVRESLAGLQAIFFQLTRQPGTDLQDRTERTPSWP